MSIFNWLFGDETEHPAYEPYLRDGQGHAFAVKVSGVKFTTPEGYTVATSDNAHNPYLHNGEGHTSPIVRSRREWRGNFLFGHWETVEERYYLLTDNGHTSVAEIAARVAGVQNVELTTVSTDDEAYMDYYDIDRKKGKR